jgi:flagellar export protein FliJ
MKRFQFRLERFLELRRHRERECELVLARILGQCILLRNRIAAIDTELGECIGRVQREGTRIDVLSIHTRDLYAQRLRRERERTGAELAARNVELEDARKKHREAQRERKILEKLRENKEREYYRLQSIEEFKTIDDINTAASTRRETAQEAGVP